MEYVNTELFHKIFIHNEYLGAESNMTSHILILEI